MVEFVVRWRLEFAALCLEIYDPVLANSSFWSLESKIQNRDLKNVKLEEHVPELDIFLREAACTPVPYSKSKLFLLRRHRDFHTARLWRYPGGILCILTSSDPGF